MPSQQNSKGKKGRKSAARVQAGQKRMEATQTGRGQEASETKEAFCSKGRPAQCGGH